MFSELKFFIDIGLMYVEWIGSSFSSSLSGESTRKGFYLYDDRRKASPDPELKKYIEKAREISGISVDPKVCFVIFTTIYIIDSGCLIVFLHGSFLFSVIFFSVCLFSVGKSK